MHRIVSTLAAFVLASALLSAGALTVSSEEPDRCAAGEVPKYVFGFADLKAHIGMAMGDPLTCEFSDPNGTGDVHQQTSAGLAFWRKRTNTPTFTDGFNHWALTPAGMVTWTGLSIDPPSLGDEQSGPTLVADVSPSDWEATALTGPVRALFTPASGALFVRTDVGALRSDDGGTTWRSVPLPPASSLATVDPTNHTVLYAAGAAGLYKTGDEARTWALVLLLPDEQVLGLAVSPADANLVYLGLASKQTGPQTFRFLRSRTGGVSWEQLDQREATLCGLGLSLLAPHPTAPPRLFRVHNCYAGRTTLDTLDHSDDQGASFTSVFRESFAFPRHLLGGQGSLPGRWYLTVDRDNRLGGSTLWRSDDDGGTWAEVLTFERARTPATGEKVAPDVDLGALAYDPWHPDRVFVALAGEGEGVRVSQDGGANWAPLGRQELGRANALALGIDGRNLYVATEHGLWRLRLTVE